jgi:ATP-binding protein involved in chromosome partitioning
VSVNEVHESTLALARLLLREIRPDLDAFLIEHDIEVVFEPPGTFGDTQIFPQHGVLGGRTTIELSGDWGFDPGPAAVELARAAAIVREGEFHEWNERPVIGPWIGARWHYPFLRPVFGDLAGPARDAGEDIQTGFRDSLTRIEDNPETYGLYDRFYSPRFEEIYDVQRGFTGEIVQTFTEAALIESDAEIMAHVLAVGLPRGNTVNHQTSTGVWLADAVKLVLMAGLGFGGWRFRRGLARVRAERPGLRRPRERQAGAYGADGARAAAQPVPGVRHVIAVASNKGGVGKTTTAVSLALALKQLGYAVGLLDADLTGPNVPTVLGIPSGTQANTVLAIVERDGIRVASTGLVLKEGLAAVWGGPLVGAGVRQLLRELPWAEAGELDYLIVDLPPGTSDASVRAAQAAPIDGVVIVTTRADIAVEDAARAVRMFRDLGVPMFGLVENMSFFEAPNGKQYRLFGRGGAQEAAEQLGLEFLGEVPFEVAPVLQRPSESPASRAIREIADQVRAKTEGAPQTVSRMGASPAPARASLVDVIRRLSATHVLPWGHLVLQPAGLARRAQHRAWERFLDAIYESWLGDARLLPVRQTDLMGAWPQERKGLWELGRFLAGIWTIFLVSLLVDAMALTTRTLALTIALLVASLVTATTYHAWVRLLKRHAPELRQEDPLAAVFSGDPSDALGIVAAQRLTPIFFPTEEGATAYLWDPEAGRMRPQVWLRGVMAAMQKIVRAPAAEDALTAFAMAGDTIDATLRGEASHAKRETLWLHWVYLSSVLSRASAARGGVPELSDASVERLEALLRARGMAEDLARGDQARYAKLHAALQVALADVYLGRYETAGAARETSDLERARDHWLRACDFVDPKDRHHWVHAEFHQMTLRLPQVLHDAWVRRAEALPGADRLDDPANLVAPRLNALASIAAQLDKLASVAIWGSREIVALLDEEPSLWHVDADAFEEDLRALPQVPEDATWTQVLAERPRVAGAIEALAEILRDRRAALQGLPPPADVARRHREPVPGVSHVIAVASNKGGVGKSTLSLNLTLQLSDLGHRVGLADADLTGPNIPTMLGVEPGSQSESGLAIVESHGIRWASYGLVLEPGSAAIRRGTQIGAGVRELLHELPWGADGGLDYLIVDLPPGTSDASVSVAEAVKMGGAIVITTGADVAVQDATRAVVMFEKLQVPILGIVENMTYFEASGDGKRYDLFGHGRGREAAERLGLEFLGEVPFAYEADPQAGVPLVRRDPHAPAAQAIRAIAERLAAQTAATSADLPAAGPGTYWTLEVPW